jgi:hypothetical protein
MRAKASGQTALSLRLGLAHLAERTPEGLHLPWTLGRFAERNQEMLSDFPKLSVKEILPGEEPEYWRPSTPKSSQRVGKVLILFGKFQPSAERLNGIFLVARQAVHLSKVEIELRLSALHLQRSRTELLRQIKIPLSALYLQRLRTEFLRQTPIFSGTRERGSQVRKVKGIVLLQFNSLAQVYQRLARILVAQQA